MARDNTNRPPHEFGQWAALQGNTNVRPFSDFGPVFTADDTATIQAAVDWSSSSGIPVGGDGTYPIDGVVIKDRARVICPGPRGNTAGVGTTFVPKSGGTAKGLFLLDTGPVQRVVLSGFGLDATGGANAGQHGIYFLAMPIFIAGAWQGGLWSSVWNDLMVQGFTGEQIWLHASGDEVAHPFSAPHQFGRMTGVVALTASTTRRALRLTGQVGQFNYDAACQFDGALGGGASRLIGTENVLIERGVDRTTFVQDSDRAPYTHNFFGSTFQSNTLAARIERATNINFIGAHFEECPRGVKFDVQAYGNSVRSCDFQNVGQDAHGTIPGRVIEATGGSETSVLVDGNIFVGPVDTHFAQSGGAQLITGAGNRHSGDTLRTSGLTKGAIAAAATITTQSFNYVYVNGSATAVNTIASDLLPGEVLVLRANGADLLLGASGNIELGAYQAPLRVPQNGSAILIRNDLSNVWLLAAVGGQNSLRAPVVFINASNSPYTVVPGSGTVNVDCTSGNVVVNLPANTLAPSGARLTVRRFDSSGNSCTINGATGGAVALTRVLQAIDFERDAIVGSGAWALVGGYNLPLAQPLIPAGSNSYLKFTKTVGGGVATQFDGSDGITLAVDADTANTASKVVARDASGNFAAHDVTVNKVIGLLQGNADTATKAAKLTGAEVTATATLDTTKYVNVTIDVAGTPTTYKMLIGT
ncbi:MAG: hypothetical protein JWL71_3683 [Acidobacteria bacterium]|nr:hypothetical protein [Acidobacteriota bacterium]